MGWLSDKWCALTLAIAPTEGGSASSNQRARTLPETVFEVNRLPPHRPESGVFAPGRSR